jgi:hypothetical protein
MSTLPPAAPPLDAEPLVPPEPARAPPLAPPLTFIPPEPLDPEPPADVPDVVLVFCEADVFWFVVALGLMVTLLCGIALNCAFVLTDVFALGVTAWPAVVLVSLLALVRFLPLPLPDPEACVPLVVDVFWLADVF